ncbi:MAG: hypothetical protein H0U38_08675 [Chloroflexia bacterium]|nr:hypothetical protein [Chloroflexia bacterium]
MSNPLRHHGNPTSHDDQHLHQDARTDAPRNDADALDAWLNEMARSDGFADTRPGNRHERPPVRNDNHGGRDDAGSLTATAASFHRRIEAAQAGHTRAAAPDPHLWEKIMDRTPAQPSVTVAATTTPANPWREPKPSKGQTGSVPRRRQQPHTSVFRRQQAWNMMANIGLVIAIVLAGFGVWRLSGEPGLPGGSGDDPNIPGVAMQPSALDATPEATETPAVAVATPQPATTCDFSGDIPIFTGVESSPIEDTAVMLTPNGDLVLTCPEEAEATTLATGVHQVTPMDWQGVVTISYNDEPEPEDWERAVLNVVTGDVVEIGSRPRGYNDLNQHPGSPWLVAPNRESPIDWSVIDLRTMETRLLSSHTSTSATGMLVHDVTTTANGNDDRLVIAIQYSNTYGGGIVDPTDSLFSEIAIASDGIAMQYGPIINAGPPGSLLVLDGSFGDARWLSMPREDQTYLDILLSPDGQHLALTSVDADFQEFEQDEIGEAQGDILYSVMRLSDGSEITQSAPTGPHHVAEMQWTIDGAGLAYLDGEALRWLPVDPDAEAGTLFEGSGWLRSLRPTTDPATIIALSLEQSGDDALISVNIESGDVIEIPGSQTHDFPSMIHPTRFLVLAQPGDPDAQTHTYHLVDVVTGQVMESVTIPVDTAEMGKGAIHATRDGTVSVVAFNAQHIYVMRLVDGEPEVNRLTMPGETGNPTGMVGASLSPDGTTVYISEVGSETRTIWMTPLTDASETWTSLSDYPGFVPGTGD